METLNRSTQAHINEVRYLLNLVIVELMKRGEEHDQSKFSDAEAPVFDRFSERLRDLEYGSDEYRDCLKAMKPALDHHYRGNRHHPEHFADGIDGMNLFDLIEMIVDWYAAGKRHGGGDLSESIAKNTDRFGIGSQLVSILNNTAKVLTGKMDHSCGNCGQSRWGDAYGHVQCAIQATTQRMTDGRECPAWVAPVPKRYR